jgi:hypothetical protein
MAKIIFALSRKGNWVSSTNNALSIATAEYVCVCFLHQDDTWLNGGLSTMKYLIDKYSKVNLFLHPSQFIAQAVTLQESETALCLLRLL